jgi:anti-sigma factor RsiW
MANDPLYHHLLEKSWRGKLTPAEEQQLRAWLSAHPEGKVDWEAEAALNELLCRLPAAPMPSNFTARVLKAAALETKAGEQQIAGSRIWTWRSRWLPRIAFASVLMAAGVISYHQGVVFRRANLAKSAAASVAVVSDVSSLPSPEVLTNFDAIYALNRTPPADEELLALLK